MVVGVEEGTRLRAVKTRTSITHLGCVVSRRITYDAQSGSTLEEVTLSHPRPIVEVAASRGRIERDLDAAFILDRVARWKR